MAKVNETHVRLGPQRSVSSLWIIFVHILRNLYRGFLELATLRKASTSLFWPSRPFLFISGVRKKVFRGARTGKGSRSRDVLCWSTFRDVSVFLRFWGPPVGSAWPPLPPGPQRSSPESLEPEARASASKGAATQGRHGGPWRANLARRDL